jgi:hypothetical protein
MTIPYLGPTAGIGNYMISLYHYNGSIASSKLESWVRRAMEEKDYDFLKAYVNTELRFVFDLGYHQPALKGLELVAHCLDEGVQQAMAELLIRIRFYYPEDVENVLLQKAFPEVINQRVWASAASEQLNDQMGMQAVGILFDLFLLGPDILRALTIYFAQQALKVPNLKILVGLIIRETLNLVAGEPIFPVPSDSPTQQFFNAKAAGVSR